MIRVTDKQYWLHPNLKKNLGTVIYNIKNGWDFVIIITGDGMTRVGKTKLGQQIGYYLSYKLGTPFTLNNIVFGGSDLIKKAHQLPKMSCIMNDESRSDLSSKKVMSQMTGELMDFFNECGKYNHVYILIATDYFDFNKGIAVTRSELLINVKRTSQKVTLANGDEVMKFTRGYYDIYGRDKKRKLYKIGKKNYDDYRIVPRDTYGEFRKYWVINEEEYEKKKDIFLTRDRSKAKKGSMEDIIQKLRTHPKLKGITYTDIANILGVSRMTIHRKKQGKMLHEDDSSNRGELPSI